VVYMAKAKLHPRGKFEFGDDSSDAPAKVCPLHGDLVSKVEETHGMVKEMKGSLDTAIHFITNSKQPPIQT
jgi:hypothetical protein